MQICSARFVLSSQLFPSILKHAFLPQALQSETICRRVLYYIYSLLKHTYFVAYKKWGWTPRKLYIFILFFLSNRICFGATIPAKTIINIRTSLGREAPLWLHTVRKGAEWQGFTLETPCKISYVLKYHFWKGIKFI